MKGGGHSYRGFAPYSWVRIGYLDFEEKEEKRKKKKKRGERRFFYRVRTVCQKRHDINGWLRRNPFCASTLYVCLPPNQDSVFS